MYVRLIKTLTKQKGECDERSQRTSNGTRNFPSGPCKLDKSLQTKRTASKFSESTQAQEKLSKLFSRLALRS
nr:MAG TPA: hypothetical protein [Caudoviricetes sp.]